MKILLFLAGLLAFLVAFGMAVMAKSAIHEAVAGIAALFGLTAVGFAAVLEEIQRSRKAIETQFAYLAEFLKNLKT